MKRIPTLIPFLAVVSAIFIGILIYAYIETRKANPQMLDERGHPLSSGVSPSPECRDESRHGRQECLCHTVVAHASAWRVGTHADAWLVSKSAT